MTLQLSKGKTLNLTKSASNILSAITLAASWDGDADIDIAALLKKDGQPVTGAMQGSLIAYPMNFADGGWTVDHCEYSGDARDGSADGYDEEIKMDLTAVDADEIILGVTSYSSGAPVTFGATENPTAFIVDQNGNELVKIELDSDAAFGTAFKLAKLSKNESGEWVLENINEQIGASANGLQDFIDAV
ncbi:chemical-damaging agent resistance protein C [Pseudoalteromonas phage J2-1_QLiu-2017]|nr:chemical-damaging agent resistance protein C [Pseudoalteromonas phage J2-1_QLiu-2017]